MKKMKIGWNILTLFDSWRFDSELTWPNDKIFKWKIRQMQKYQKSDQTLPMKKMWSQKLVNIPKEFLQKWIGSLQSKLEEIVKSYIFW